MRVAVDTNVLIPLLRGRPEEEAVRAADALVEYDQQGQLVICPLVWSELGVLIEEKKLRAFLVDNRIRVDWELPLEVWSEAADAFAQYLKNRRKDGSAYYCAGCGSKIDVKCLQCGALQGFPRHIMPDFIISAHALRRADVLITADKGIPRRYFPALKVFNPLDPGPGEVAG